MALRAGGGVCLAIAVPFAFAARWAADRDDTGLAVLLSLAAVGGFIVGAGVAAWVQTTGLPYAHGIVVALVTYFGAQGVFIVLRLAMGRNVHWFAVMFNVAPVLFAGVIGGLLGSALQRSGALPSARRGSARPGSARPGSARPGSARRGDGS